MENRGSKAMAIAALLVGIVGLSIGFAAFANTLTINTEANVTPDNRLDVTFHDDFVCTHSANNNAEASTATIVANSSKKSLQVVANMKHPGDTVTCTGQIDNADTLDAYLNSVSGIGLGTPTATGTVQDGNAPTTALMNAAASDITMTVKVNNDTFTSAVTAPTSTHKLGRGENEPVVITITYGGTTYVDGNFKVVFPEITLNYSTVDAIGA